MPEIREAVPDDAAGIIAFMKLIADEPNNFIVRSSAEEFTLTEDEERKFIADFAQSENSVIYVALSDTGQIIGVASCAGGKRSATRHGVTIGVSVHPDWRGQGIGRAVMQKLVDWGRQNALVHRMELQVFADNHRAIALYESLGFQREAYLRETMLKYDQWRDDLLMALLFEKALT